MRRNASDERDEELAVIDPCRRVLAAGLLASSRTLLLCSWLRAELWRLCWHLIQPGLNALSWPMRSHCCRSMEVVEILRRRVPIATHGYRSTPSEQAHRPRIDRL